MEHTGLLLIRGGTVVPLAGGKRFEQADVLVRGDEIIAIGTSLAAPADVDVVDAFDALVVPGFVQSHVHVVQSLARHRAEGLLLLPWLKERIWPYEAALTAAEVAAAARLGIAELLLGGTTAALDMGTTHDQDEVFAAAEMLGIRFTSGKTHMDSGADIPAGLLEDSDESLREAERLGARWHGAAVGRLRYAVAPRFILSCSPALLAGCARLARTHGYLLHTHASENAEETRIVRDSTGRGNVAALAEFGIAGRDTVLAHCVHLDDDEITAMALAGTGVAHCPGANLKLGSGIADIPRLLAAGVRIGLGADGPPCNNRLSAFHEMALAGTIHNLRHGPLALDPWTVLELATWRGAEMLGLDRVGRLLSGWKADITVIAPERLSMEPCGDPAAMIVFGADASCVRHVVVAGRTVVRDGALVTGDVATIRLEARRAASAIASRLGWA